MGNDTIPATSDQQTGFFNTITSNLGNLAKVGVQALPIINSLTGKGGKTSNNNGQTSTPAMSGVSAIGGGGISTTTLLVIGAAVAAVIGLMLFVKK